MTAVRILAVLMILLNIGGVVQAQLVLPSTARLSPIKNADEKRETIRQIRDDLSRSAPNAKLLGCSTLINYIQQMQSGHDTSFGAVCKIIIQNKVHSVTLCDDRMVGKFFKSEQFAKEPEQLGLFVETHCPPGG